jgi:hypothetical protein
VQLLAKARESVLMPIILQNEEFINNKVKNLGTIVEKLMVA